LNDLIVPLDKEWLELNLFSNIEPAAQEQATKWLWVYNNEWPHTEIGGFHQEKRRLS